MTVVYKMLTERKLTSLSGGNKTQLLIFKITQILKYIHNYLIFTFIYKYNFAFGIL